jgi:ABC-type proline/glycine betaine transport system permease subunit/glycine betaine/choline ABC-type transport system substrate-binding protein
VSEILAALAGLGDELAAHVILAAAALALGIAVALPLAVWASRSRGVARVAIGTASVIQTIPALALLALFFPILLSLRAVFGAGLPALGFLPALLALALYALLPILRNAVTARIEMDPGVIEAADALGMTPAQKLRLVEAPLAAPFVMAGIRTAAVWTIGAATLSTTVGQPSLGDPIFAGLQTQNWSLVLAGCLAAVALALVADGLLGLVERGLKLRRPLLVWAGIGAIAVGLLAAAASGYRSGGGDGRRVVTIGAKNFSEQYILARLIGDRLQKAGYTVRYREGLGSAVIHRALTSGTIDVYVDYSGTVWANEMKREGTPPRAAMLADIAKWEQASSGSRMIGALGFENAYAFAMRGERARDRGIVSLADLAARGRDLTIGGDLEFFRRPEWRAVDAAYGLGALRQKSFAPTFMYDALASGDADVVTAFSSDGRIAADGLAVLTDPKQALPGYDAMLLVAPAHAQDRRFLEALAPLVGAIPVAAMREANYQVDRTADKQTPEAAARWLAQHIRR